MTAASNWYLKRYYSAIINRVFNIMQVGWSGQTERIHVLIISYLRTTIVLSFDQISRNRRRKNPHFKCRSCLVVLTIWWNEKWNHEVMLQFDCSFPKLDFEVAAWFQTFEINSSVRLIEYEIKTCRMRRCQWVRVDFKMQQYNLEQLFKKWCHRHPSSLYDDDYWNWDMGTEKPKPTHLI